MDYRPTPTAAAQAAPSVSFGSGEQRPALGLGTWRLGEDAARRAAEIKLLRDAFDAGWRVVDSAEMYGDGGAEAVTGQALAEALRGGIPRSDCFVVSKVLPQHAGGRALQAACEASLRRLQLDCIDLYLLHWRGAVPLAQTVAGFEQLQQRGLIRQWGVSNFDVDDLVELSAVAGGDACAANQVYFSLGQRGAGFELLPWQQRRRMPLMAYSPLAQGALLRHAVLQRIATGIGATPAQLALAWLLHQPGVMAIPKAGSAAHLRDNRGAAALQLHPDVLAELDRAFPAPRARTPLAVL